LLKKHFWDSKKEKKRTNNCPQKIIGWDNFVPQSTQKKLDVLLQRLLK
jgi:hypothetical protein